MDIWHVLMGEPLDGFVYHNVVCNQFNVYSIYQHGVYLVISVGECLHSNYLMHIRCKQRSGGAGGQDVPLTHSAALLRSVFAPESLCLPRPPARSSRCQADTSGRSAGPGGEQEPGIRITILIRG